MFFPASHGRLTQGNLPLGALRVRNSAHSPVAGSRTALGSWLKTGKTSPPTARECTPPGCADVAPHGVALDEESDDGSVAGSSPSGS